MKSLVIALALLFTAFPAFADEPATGRMEFGYETLTVRKKHDTVNMRRITLAPEIDIGEEKRAQFAPLLRLTTTTIDLMQKRNMDFDATLALPWQPSIGGRFQYQVLHWWRLHFSIAMEYEFAPGLNRAELTSFTPKGEIANLDIDVDVLRQHVTVEHAWQRSQGGVRILGDIGPVHPYVDLGLIVITGRMTVDFDERANELLKDANLSPDRSYNGNAVAPLLQLGVSGDLGAGFIVRAAGAYLTQGGKTLSTVNASLYVPISVGE